MGDGLALGDGADVGVDVDLVVALGAGHVVEVDDRAALAKDDQFLFTQSDGTKKAIKDIGDIYSTMQIENFRNASQPLYAIISPDEILLNLPVAYTPDIDSYASWLKSGIDAFAKVKDR